MAKKWGKYLFGLAAVGAVVAGVIHLKKENCGCCCDDDFEDDFEDEDFDLDEDLAPAGERGYVTLNTASDSKPETAEEVKTEETKEEASPDSEQ